MIGYECTNSPHQGQSCWPPKSPWHFPKTVLSCLTAKRNILIQRNDGPDGRASNIQNKIDDTYAQAYQALQMANITLGICSELSKTVPLDNSLNIAYRSVMGVEIPMISIGEPSDMLVPYGLNSTNIMMDRAFLKFNEVKQLTAELAEVENSVYRLADAIKKTQKRANALKNIMIPRFEETVKFITDSLEEKEREEFSRLKIIKRQKEKLGQA